MSHGVTQEMPGDAVQHHGYIGAEMYAATNGPSPGWDSGQGIVSPCDPQCPTTSEPNPVSTSAMP